MNAKQYYMNVADKVIAEDKSPYFDEIREYRRREMMTQPTFQSITEHIKGLSPITDTTTDRNYEEEFREAIRNNL